MVIGLFSSSWLLLYFINCRVQKKYYNLKYSNTTSNIQEIQSFLDNKSAIINYFVGDTIIFISSITVSDYKIVTIKTDSTFEGSVIDYYRSIRKLDVKQFLAVNSLLYKKLIDPIKGEIAQKENLIIIPDDYLYYIPFESLITDSTHSEDFSDMNYLVNL